MTWSEWYQQNNQPTIENISDFINNNLFDDLCLYLETTYGVCPMIEYSKCSMQRGWNIKYKKSGKSLCTIYPMEGYFIVLVVIGEKEQMEAELVITNCSAYVQTLFQKTACSCGGRWLMIDVKDHSTLLDVQALIQTRVKLKKPVIV